MEPLQPAHADKTVAIAGADPRFTVRRILTGYAYANHGNLHNPTPQYQWQLLFEGRTVDVDAHKRTLVAAARADVNLEYSR